MERLERSEAIAKANEYPEQLQKLKEQLETQTKKKRQRYWKLRSKRRRNDLPLQIAEPETQ